jgi:hypothetical protein
MANYKQNMGAVIHNDGSASLSFLSGLCAILSIADIQPFLTFVGSIIAIVSGIVSIYKKTKKK